MRGVRIRALAAISALGVLPSCSGLLPSQAPEPPPPPSDPTPLSKCQVAASATSPLVTEWPASEKAHLQSLATLQTVAVEYSGCELRIVDGCQLPGSYSWSRTTLATDTLSIDNADELYAKLPIGAVALEGELAHSGRLAVRTTVAGQLRAQGMTEQSPESPACASATHFISAISIGAFQLLSGSSSESSASASVGPAGGGVQARRRETVLREAGSRDACNETQDEAPNSQCASPIQVFLSPLAPKAKQAQGTEVATSSAQNGAVYISFPPPPDEGEVWTLRGPGGKVLCSLPCGQWVGPVSGYYLQREPRNGADEARLELPQSFAHPVGSRVTAEYQLERGNALIARWGLYGAIFYGVAGAGITTWGIVEATQDCSEDDLGCRNTAIGPVLIGTGAFVMLIAAGGAWWSLYSREEKFVTYEDLGAASKAGSSLKVMVGPTGLRGSF